MGEYEDGWKKWKIVVDECHKLKNVLANKQADIRRYQYTEL